MSQEGQGGYNDDCRKRDSRYEGEWICAGTRDIVRRSHRIGAKEVGREIIGERKGNTRRQRSCRWRLPRSKDVKLYTLNHTDPTDGYDTRHSWWRGSLGLTDHTLIPTSRRVCILPAHDRRGGVLFLTEQDRLQTINAALCFPRLRVSSPRSELDTLCL